MQSDVYALGLLLYQMVVADLRRPLATGWQRDVDDELLREDISAATEGRPDKRIKSAAELVSYCKHCPSVTWRASKPTLPCWPRNARRNCCKPARRAARGC